jgi:peptidoglycan/LPS O-acetylase OafA/YrhL
MAARWQPGSEAMKPEVSLYLDAVRFSAALVVFLAHFALQRLGGGFLWQLNDYGHEAVTVFFVLSGYVIAYASDTRETSAREYAISRLARLYSVALPAVLLTVLLDQVGSHWRPSGYRSEWGIDPEPNIRVIVAALSFTNEIWTQSLRLGSNPAYWSMGYEVPYYVIFGLAHFCQGRWRWPLVALALLLAGPSIAASFPLWLMGVWVYRYTRDHSPSAHTGLWLFGGSLLLWLAYELAALRWGRLTMAGNVWFRRREMMQDYLVGSFFAANLIGFQAAAQRLGAPLLRRARTLRWLAGATFTLYLCHFPVAQFIVAFSPWPNTDPRTQALVLGGTLVAIFLLAAVTERRKHAWRRLFERCWPASNIPAPRGHPP